MCALSAGSLQGLKSHAVLAAPNNVLQTGTVRVDGTSTSIRPWQVTVSGGEPLMNASLL